MRRRPEVKLQVSPREPGPGDQLHVVAVLTSAAETPIDGVMLRLLGVERRFVGGNVQVHQIISFVRRSKAMTLTPGEHRVEGIFDLPSGLPPSFDGELGSIEYSIEVSVRIPWWFDRRRRYTIFVAARSASKPARTPRTFSTPQPKATELSIEASVDTTEIEAGAQLSGAVSLQNSQFHAVRRIEIAFVAIDHALIASQRTRVTVVRYVIDEREPRLDGEPVRFSTRLRPEAPPTFRATLFELSWYIEVRAVVTLGRDVTLAVPIRVFPAAAGGPSVLRGVLPREASVPPVGRERRALIWREVAKRAGIVADPEGNYVTYVVEELSLVIGVERLDDRSLHHVARLTWPGLGLDLQVDEPSLLGVFRPRVELGDADFARRLWVRGREPAQLRAFLDEHVREALLRFEHVTMDDQTCMLASRGAGHSISDVEAFVSLSLGAAHLLGKAIRRVPPPALMAAHLEAWRTFAQAHGARLELGRMWIHGADWSGERLDIGTQWTADGTLDATVIRLTMPPLDNGDAYPSLSDEFLHPGFGFFDWLPRPAQPYLQALRVQTRSLRIPAGQIEVTVPAPLDDPANLEPLLATMRELSRALRGAPRREPYR